MVASPAVPCQLAISRVRSGTGRVLSLHVPLRAPLWDKTGCFSVCGMFCLH